MIHYPVHLNKLIEVLKRLPGVGTKSAERFAFHMLSWPDDYLQEMGEVIAGVVNQIQICNTCGCLTNQNQPCSFCHLDLRDSHIICLVASPRDVFAIERTREYKGLYHVLGGLLSPIEGRGPEVLALHRLIDRLEKHAITEIVIALDATLEGDATALYLKQALGRDHLNISRLAFGLPLGSSLDYVDGDTLARALSGRNSF